jgi:1-pyrroline-5-carboxylate dehydrogenase
MKKESVMNNGIFHIPHPVNEPVLAYAPGSPERTALKKEIARLRTTQLDIPLIIDGKEVRTGTTAPIRRPDAHGEVLGVYHLAGEAEVRMAIEAAMAAKAEWAALPWEERAAVFLRAAELISVKYRALMDAATMLCQSKTAHQAEIDAVCEVTDFLRFNPFYMEQIYAQQPENVKGEWNRSAYRPLEGFVYAVTPFNFTSIAANLPSAPAMMGNTVVWKPASNAVYSNYMLMKLYMEAGLPPGVINFLPGSGGLISNIVLSSPDFAGFHFTGSTDVFRSLWKQIAANLERYRTYPRIVGETGGKDFILIDPSADLPSTVTAVLRGAFEYQGQKCSAASRLYIPASRAKEFTEALVEEISAIPMGEITDFRNFMGAVIDETAFDTIRGYIERAKNSRQARILAGGTCDKSKGWFIEPTLILTEDPQSESMVNEIFGPVLTAYVYDDRDMEAVYRLIDTTSPYGLTGAIMATDRGRINRALTALQNAAGNLYINDKPTGAVVGRQPFGGARASGTNDKAGSYLNLLRWVSAVAIKENFAPPSSWRYPFMMGDD